ncbi:hypothetical protein EIP91_005293 [Steccherinum ochraceum]|uniref:Metaxin glutathione S-transferase domain-containing protein n=1 Tax=Steccherinum ochraceum TaxID=92696 RepID=A0A4V2MVU8_9APHY|nr:hypothetical protein EIP91_005293 [Steccherinum ochraceum]
MASLPTVTLPKPLHQLFSLFPLHTFPPVPVPTRANPITRPTLWVHPPRTTEEPSSEVFSSDVECLKWQAYLALRGVANVALRWDVSPDGAIEGRLPNLHVPLAESKDGGGELLPAASIADWVDGQVGETGSLEGYVDEAAKDESRAWVTLLEGNVHAALVLFHPKPLTLQSLISPFQPAARPIESMLTPPPPPLTGLSSLLPVYGFRIDRTAVEERYKEAISSLSERLGTNKWFLGSSAPTALDALLFAYLHCLLHCQDNALRFEVTRRVNLVAWERRVQTEVRAAFKPVY